MGRHEKGTVDVDFMEKEVRAAAADVIPTAEAYFERLPNHGSFRVRVSLSMEHSLAMPLAAILADPDLPAKLARQAAIAVHKGMRERLYDL